MCIYETGGDAERSLAVVNDEPLPFMHDTALAILKHRLGDPLAAQQHFDSMLATYGDSSAYQYGQVHAQWGESDKALDWLETALAVRDPGLMQINTDDLLDPLRSEPRFARILDASGLRLVY
jgi:serine/threonine-protein kinase